MTSKQPYSYVVLRYIHDIVTGEFVNVGLVFVAPLECRVFAKTRKTIGRIKSVFPDLDRHSFVVAMETVDRGMREIRKLASTEGLFSEQKNAASYARMILSTDDSSLQWSPVGSGVTGDPEAAFARLFERFVTRYDTSSPRRKSDDDVWKPVRDLLSERGVNVPLEKKVVKGKSDTIEFSRAWKNGLWHVYEPLSFDLADADGIKDKARLWRGHLASVADGTDDSIQLNFLVGKPENRALLSAYESAVGILRDAPFHPTIFEDNDLGTFVDNIEDEVRQHLEGNREKTARGHVKVSI